jgi:hypothetical protein
MTKEKLIEDLQELCNQRIKYLNEVSLDPKFKKLKAIVDSPWGYRLFFPINSNFGSQGMNTEDFLELYRLCCYCWEDDGNLSLVFGQAIEDTEDSRSVRNMLKDTKFSNHIGNRPLSILENTFIVRRGDSYKDKYTKEHISEQIIFHGPSGYKSHKFIACPFNPDDLNFIYNLVPEINKLKELALLDEFDYPILEDPYHLKEKELKFRFLEHIIDHKYNSGWIKL